MYENRDLPGNDLGKRKIYHDPIGGGSLSKYTPICINSYPNANNCKEINHQKMLHTSARLMKGNDPGNSIRRPMKGRTQAVAKVFSDPQIDRNGFQYISVGIYVFIYLEV